MPGSEVSSGKNPTSSGSQAAYLALPKRQVIVKRKATGSREGAEPGEHLAKRLPNAELR